MRNLFRISLCMTALALLCLTIPARAGDSVPFKATAGTVTTDIQFAPCGAIFTNVGAGEATHLGLFTLIDQSCSHPPGYVNNEGGMTLTAANGDQLFLTTHGAIDPATFIETAGFVIAGGTGRFLGATGEGIYTGYFIPDPHLYTLDGTIDFKKK